VLPALGANFLPSSFVDSWREQSPRLLYGLAPFHPSLQHVFGALPHWIDGHRRYVISSRFPLAARMMALGEVARQAAAGQHVVCLAANTCTSHAGGNCHHIIAASITHARTIGALPLWDALGVELCLYDP
jgi:hypothetical protein